LPLCYSRIMDGVYLTEDRAMEAMNETIAMRRNEQHVQSQLLQGYAGWAPSQLAGEIRANVW
jgi:putative AlgH/UPF0301 family transcriptional regulator